MALGSLIGAVGGLTQGIIQGNQQRENIKQTHKNQMELQEYQYSKDLEMWNKANLYNSPEEQMQRLKEAGINPHMAHGSGSVSNTSSSTLPKYQAPKQDFSGRDPLINPLQILGAFQDFKLKNAQIDNVQADSAVRHKEAIIKGNESRYSPQYYQYRSNEKRQKAQSEAFDLALRTNSPWTNYAGQKFNPFELSGGKLYASQRDAAARKVSELDERIALLNKENEWFTTKMWTGMALNALGKISGLVRPGLKGISGKFK